MVSKEEIDVVKNSGFSHRTCTANAFFSRLEDDLDRAAELVQIFLNPIADRDAHRCVTVMAAGMHMTGIGTCPAFIKRTVTGFVSFVHVNAVHVETDG